MDEKFKMTKEQVVESPKDVILEGVIVDVKISTFSKELDEEKKKKFEDQDSLLIERVFIKVDCAGTIVDNNLPYYPTPSDNSSLGKFLVKYDTLEVGTKVKVQFGGKGIGKILIE